MNKLFRSRGSQTQPERRAFQVQKNSDMVLLSVARICIMLLCLALPVGTALAAEDPASDVTELSLSELLKVKVLKVNGVSRYEQSALEAPAHVTVITAEDIQRYDYRLLSDLLKGVAGLYVTDDRNYRYLGYRGFSRPGDYNTKVLIMLDGVRLNDEVYHQAPIGFDFPLDLRLVERVEVIRGPSQAIYGNNAFLLVINVISKAPAGTRQIETEISADSRGGTTERMTLSGPISNAGDGLLFSGSLLQSSGSDLYLPANDTPETNNGIAHGCDYARSGSAFFKYNQSKFSLLGGYLQDTKGIPTGSWGTIFNDSTSRTKDQRFFADLSYLAVQAPSGTLRLRSYLNAYNYDGAYASTSDPTYRDLSRAVTAGAEVLGNIVLPGKHILAGGIDFRHGFKVQQADTTGYDDNRTVSELGIFIQDEYRPFEPLILTGSVRYDYLTQGLQTVNPKGAAVLLPMDGLALKYLFGRSFRAPNAYERYYAANGFLANPGLREEVMYSNELVAEYEVANDLKMTVTGFQYDYRNLISQYLAADGLSRFKNAGRIRTRGVESEITATWQAWSGVFSHTFQNTTNAEDPGQPVFNSPHNLVKLRLSRELLNRKLTVSSELNYTSQIATLQPGQNASDYVLVNLTILGRNILIKGLDASLSVYNLFDRRYSQPGGFEHLPTTLIPQEGITGDFRVSYRF